MISIFKIRPGFTLIEIILTLVLVGIMATMIVPYFKSGTTSAYIPIDRLGQSALLTEAMDTLVSDYVNIKDKNKTNIDKLVADFPTDHGSICPSCTISSQEIIDVTGWALPSENAILVTITSPNKETISHVFTVQ